MNKLLTAALASIIFLSGCNQTAAPVQTPQEQQETAKQETTTTPKRITAKVIEVIDGDTIKVSINGSAETVRFLLIDTPETKHPSKHVQPFGPEASKFTANLLNGKQVELEKDITERDKYGRLLFYVYIDGKSAQEQLLAKGLARVSIYPPDVKYVDKYRAIQDQARKGGIGIWSIENYAQEDGYHTEAQKPVQPAPQPTPQPAPQPKPAQNIYYRNCAEARAAGVAPLYQGDPGYRSGLDRDHDGVACE